MESVKDNPISCDTTNAEKLTSLGHVSDNRPSGSETTPLIGESWWQKIPKRHVVAVMAFWGFFNVYALRVNLSVAIVAMAEDYDWDTKLQGIILASFFWGYIVTQIPGGYIAGKFGGRNLFGGGIFCTAVLTVLTPLAASVNVGFVLAVRVIEGLFEGVTFPAMHAMWGIWAPPFEKTKLATSAWSGTFIGTVVAMPLSGLLAQHVSWQSIFYCFGSVAILWSLAWFYLIRDSPEKHETITSTELDYIHSTIGIQLENTKNLSTPWTRIITSLPVCAIVLAHFSENWGFYTMITELPTYLKDALNYDLDKSGLIAAIPYMVISITVACGGQIADYICKRGLLNTTNVRKLFTCSAFLSQAIFMSAAASTNESTAAIIFIICAVGLGGFASSGYSVNHLDIAPQFAGVLMGISNCIATIPGIVSPTITGQITTQKTQEEWKTVFFIAAGIYFVGAIFYGLFASGEKQNWSSIPSAYSPVKESKSSEDIPFKK
ncbi:sialin-like [Centruroides vittatus]|uniref:sialin-like n=1 Tax=Centruroides vittatus TaxID=120091 RepID=UPI00350F1E0F